MKKVRKKFLVLRNICVIAASVLFIASVIPHKYEALLRGIGYIFGAFAYLFELLELTGGFKKKIQSEELLMVYCFGPLYIIMAVTYIISHFSAL